MIKKTKKPKKPKKPTRSLLVKKADRIFSIFIRLRDCDKDGYIVCPLCWAKIYRKDAQNMHFITRGCWLYRYDEINCHAGCMRCNVILNGNYIEYSLWMIDQYWLEKVQEMKQKSKEVHKIPTYELESIIEYYTARVEELAKEKGISLN